MLGWRLMNTHELNFSPPLTIMKSLNAFLLLALLPVVPVGMMKICPSLPPCTCRRYEIRSFAVCTAVRNVSALSAAIPLDGPDNLLYVNIVNSNIPSLPSRAFGTLRAYSLHINASNLTNIASNAFVGLEDLHFLAIQDNALNTVPAAAIRRLVALKLLSFAGNQIVNVSNRDFITLVNLSYLSLSENLIERIDKGSFPPLLAQLALGTNKLESLNRGISNLPRLEWLLLSNNSLHTLDVHQFKALPVLKQLLLSNNRLEYIDGAFEELTELSVLSMNNNKINSVENVFNFMPNLRDLRLAQNRITKLGQLGNLPTLNSFELSENNMEDIVHNAFEKTPTIARLNLSDNSLLQFPVDALSYLGSLVVLDLARNKLQSPISVGQLRLPALKYLSLAGNKLTTLPDNLFEAFPSLQELDVTFNLVTTFDMFNHLPLKMLHLQGNPLRCDLKTMRALDEMDGHLDYRPTCTNAILPISQEETN